MSNSSSALKVVFLDRATIPPSIRLKELPFSHEFELFERTAAEDVSARIRDADVVITNKVRLTAADLSQATRLKLVAVAATGTDNVDLAVCDERNIIVSNVRNYATHTVPEHTFALIFALRRSLAAYREAVRAGRWAESGQFCFFDFPIRDLAGSTIGIVGDGALGTATANIARALGLRVLFSAYKGRTDMGPLYTPFDQVLRESDIITLHCPLTSSTRDLISDAEFAAMTRKPILINTARGGLVNESALVRALHSNQISGAGFDVVTEEPLPEDHPFTAILDHPGFILTPHVAWASEEAIQGLADQLIDNVSAFVQGAPQNVVTKTP
ncbi:D-2-hydroxyacid dehydrogenase [Paraburkholderia caribensis]|uniref:D-2-hydroxyacid dehydrogenase n=1 Tax=Paraburkholderia caribensis TaxID=75105 RepID=UPI00071F781E|nr:D-2-hydroxyacid dehydrogenase [Paraburkholderia caribensis]ALP68752.1 glycerate dehydrogenase [Paraburkholderia caribensis]AUT57864.1 glycerate dehydrogenase [Paraburkholderia caribensis]